MDFQNSKEHSFADILLNNNLKHLLLILSEKKMLLQDTGVFSPHKSYIDHYVGSYQRSNL